MMIVLAFGNVEAVLDDRRRQQHVELPRDEIEHRPLERVLVHLPVADDDPRLGHQPLHQVADREDRLDPVVDEVDLAAARQLAPDRARGSPPGSNLTTLV